MSRFHLHIAVDDLDRNIAFYSTVFGAVPTVIKPDYAKWQLDNPVINFAISTRGAKPGLDHVGIQADSEEELSAIRRRLEEADIQGLVQENTACCYARSNKYWIQDRQGIAWESFHTLGEAAMFSMDTEHVSKKTSACCTPSLSGCCAQGAAP